MKISPFLRGVVLSAACLPLLLAASASAVQVLDPVKGPYAVTPDPTFPWYNLGNYLNPDDNGNASTIFIGDINGNGTYWALTASHNGKMQQAEFDGVTYNIVQDSFQQVFAGSEPADLYLYQLDITSLPSNLATLQITGSTPAPSQELYLFGMGANEAPWGTPHWGHAYADGPGHPRFGSIVFGTSVSLNGPFSDLSLGWAQDKDSGGGVLYQSGGVWYLAGIMMRVGYNEDTNVVTTYSIDLAYYRSQIYAKAVPEPGSVVLLLGSAAAVLGFAARQRARRGR